MAYSKYQRTYTSFSGADIMATFNGMVIGSLQSITYSVTREKAPVYVMGRADPASFSRGKRGIAGSMVFSVFDRDFFNKLKQGNVLAQYASFKANNSAYAAASVAEWEETMQGIVDGNDTTANQPVLFEKLEAMYADQIPPFDVVINMINEYGQAASMAINGVEILNEGSGMSIDDITTDKACTFVARGITHLTPLTNADGTAYNFLMD